MYSTLINEILPKGVYMKYCYLIYGELSLWNLDKINKIMYHDEIQTQQDSSFQAQSIVQQCLNNFSNDNSKIIMFKYNFDKQQKPQQTNGK